MPPPDFPPLGDLSQCVFQPMCPWNFRVCPIYQIPWNYPLSQVLWATVPRVARVCTHLLVVYTCLALFVECVSLSVIYWNLFMKVSIINDKIEWSSSSLTWIYSLVMIMVIASFAIMLSVSLYRTHVRKARVIHSDSEWSGILSQRSPWLAQSLVNQARIYKLVSAPRYYC